MKTVSICELAAWCGLSERRLRQLAAAEQLPKPSAGLLPMPEAAQKLFQHFREAHTSLAGERLKLTRAKRRLAERQLTTALGGGLVPLQVVQEAITVAGHRLNRLISADFYNLGGRRLSETEEQVCRRAVTEAIQDLRGYVEQTVARHAEILAESGGSTSQGDEQES